MAATAEKAPLSLRGQIDLLTLRQKELDAAFRADPPKADALRLCVEQHAHLHPGDLAAEGLWSLEDNILESLPENLWRSTPADESHAIAWLLWHLTRCEDITTNLLAARTSQVLLSGGWQQRLGVPDRDTGNTQTPEQRSFFNSVINLAALRDYPRAVTRQTRAVIQSLEPAELPRKVGKADMQRVWDEGALLPGAEAIGAYWGNRTVAGLLLMPATRHQLQHLTEAAGIRRKLEKS